MIIDKEEHRGFILDMLNKIQVAGAAIDFLYEFKQAVVTATVKDPTKEAQLEELPEEDLPTEVVEEE